MVQLATFLIIAIHLAFTTNARPTKRIAQVIADSTTKWVEACRAAGGEEQCGEVSQAAFMTLLAAGDPCDHQDAADKMVTLAKSLSTPPPAQMISLAQVFVQQPRNTPESTAVLYCQKAPANAELEGLFQCQFQGAKQAVFTGGVAVGATGTIPRGFNSPLSPAGSCPASPTGPIADGTQLTDTTTDPGLANVKKLGGSAATPTAASTTTPSTTTQSATASASAESDDCDDDETSTSLSATSSVSAKATATPSTAPTSGAMSFQHQNGLDAQTLNQHFATITASSSCEEGTETCLSNGSFAQCVYGKLVEMPCGTGTVCAALPLVNKPGTSITCTTNDDRDSRINLALGTTAETSGSDTENNGAAAPATTATAATEPATTEPTTTPSASSTPSSTGPTSFKKQNGLDAQKLNSQFAILTTSSSCTTGQNACLSNGSFAQCVGGKFVEQPCGAPDTGLICAALPLVNSKGTSVTCTTASDRDARIATALAS